MIASSNDFTGLGLFSKTGRNLSEKMPMLAKRIKHTPYSRTLKTQGDQDEDNKIGQDLNSKPPNNNHRTKDLKRLGLRQHQLDVASQPFTRVVSRQKRESLLGPRDKIPDAGQYRPHTQSKPKMVWDILDVFKRQSINKERLGELRSKLASNIKYHNHDQSRESKSPRKQTLPGESMQKSQISGLSPKRQSDSVPPEQNQALGLSMRQSAIRSSYSPDHTNPNKAIGIAETKSRISINKTTERPQSLELSGTYKKRSKTQHNETSPTGLVQMRHMLGRDSYFPSRYLRVEDNKSVEGVDNDTLRDSLQRSSMNEHSLSPKPLKPKGSVEFSKQVSRQTKIATVSSPGTDYDCNYEYIKKKITVPGPDFGKVPPRKELKNQVWTESSTYYEYDKFVWKESSHIFSRYFRIPNANNFPIIMLA